MTNNILKHILYEEQFIDELNSLSPNPKVGIEPLFLSHLHPLEPLLMYLAFRRSFWNYPLPQITTTCIFSPGCSHLKLLFFYSPKEA